MSDVKGRATTSAHGVTFRLEIERLRDTIMLQLLDHGPALQSAIDEAIAEGLQQVGPMIRNVVERAIRETTEQMVRATVANVIYDGKLRTAVEVAVREAAARTEVQS